MTQGRDGPGRALERLRGDLRRRLVEGLASASLDDPFLPSLLRWAERPAADDAAQPAADDPAGEAPEAAARAPVQNGLEQARTLGSALLHHWAERRLGGPDGPRRYRWDLPTARWLDPADLTAWRPVERELAQRQPQALADRLWLPALLGDTVEWLAATAASGPDAGLAARLLDEAAPRVADDLARRIEATDPWGDTHLAAVFTARRRALDRFDPLVRALQARYVTLAEASGQRVTGRQFPFNGTPLPSASAHLASAIVALGQGMDLLGSLVGFLRRTQRVDGGWGDPELPTDLLTTLACARVLASLEPGWDPRSVLPAIERTREAANGWRVLGPEWPYVAAELASFLDALDRPFHERFRWPHYAPWLIDPHSKLPRFAAYQEIAALAAAVDGLGSARLEVAFIDLAAFGKWNSKYGMQRGDEVLEFFGQQLRTIRWSRTIQDGGDEDLVVGAPGRARLGDDLGDLFDRWPERFADRFPGLDTVAPRAVVADVAGEALLAGRERLGKAIGPLKRLARRPPPNGVIRRLD